jgi:PIN domain nuclease of toxin-antitoxin system
LPELHRDPFDRALIAQAIVEKLTMLTTDNSIQQYASDRFRFLA